MPICINNFREFKRRGYKIKFGSLNPEIILADEPTGNLDSAHGDEVMKILAQLHENGTTIVMVTHSPAYAEYGHRTIHLFDGHIVTENIKEKFHV